MFRKLPLEIQATYHGHCIWFIVVFKYRNWTYYEPSSEMDFTIFKLVILVQVVAKELHWTEQGFAR